METVVFEVKEDFTDELSDKFVDFSNSLTIPSLVVLEIESQGGQAQSLERIVNEIYALKEKGFVFATSVENYAYSCAFALFLTGDIRLASDEAKFIDHPPFLEIDDIINAEDAKEIFEVLSYFQNVRDRIISENTNISPEAFNLLRKNETFMDRNDLIFLGLMENEYEL
jgi:ATP-dependent protease ClpP protease subunit